MNNKKEIKDTSMNIAYITERDINSEHITGSITRDIKLLSILNAFAHVSIFYADTTIYHKYQYLINNRKIPTIISEINNTDYDYVIISTFPISPFLMGYKHIKHKVIYYLCDSSYHIYKNISFRNIKNKIVAGILKRKEKSVIAHNQCAYLGADEISSLPVKYRKNGVVFPFFIEKQRSLFSLNGHLVFVGNYSFWPNYQALMNIIDFAPFVSCDIKIFGINIPKIKSLPENIKIIGFTDKLKDVYTGARALLYPISYGTGVKNKVIEAMSYGVPVIGYKNAFTNLSVSDGKDCLIVKNMNELIESVENADFEKLSNNASLFVENKLSKVSVLDAVQKVLVPIGVSE